MADQTERQTKPTVYVILKESDAGYQALGTIAATGPETALRAAGLDSPEPGHDEIYVLVPRSNWTEIEVSSEQPPPKLTLTRVEPGPFRQFATTVAATAPTPADPDDEIQRDGDE